MLRITLIAWLLVFLTVPVGVGLAETPVWVNDGLVASEFTGMDQSLFLTTQYGFHKWCYTLGQWLSFVETGVPGREITAIVQYPDFTGGAITGRLNETGQGYLERTHIEGLPNELAYESTTGEIVALELMEVYQGTDEMWAATQGGVLLRSIDGGVSWQEVAGHGMTTIFDLATGYYDLSEIFVAGNEGIVRSIDFGITWEPFSSGLPEGQVRDIFFRIHNVIGIPGKWNSIPPIIFAATDDGLFVSGNLDPQWEMVLPDSCVQTNVWVNLGNFSEVLARTTDGRLLYCSPEDEAGWVWEDWTDTLPAGILVGVASRYEGMFVAMSGNGVFRTGSQLTDVPNLAPQLALKAAPNPFNPGTVLQFEAPAAGHATLRAYDVAGRKVADLLDESVAAGMQSITWHPEKLSSGIYLLRLSLGGMTTTQRVVLTK